VKIWKRIRNGWFHLNRWPNQGWFGFVRFSTHNIIVRFSTFGCNSSKISVCHGGLMVKALDFQSSRRVISRPFHWLWASCSHTRASVTKQYNLVLAKGWWCSAAEKATVSLAQSNGNLPTAGFLMKSSAGWLPRDWHQLWPWHYKVGGVCLQVKLCDPHLSDTDNCYWSLLSAAGTTSPLLAGVVCLQVKLCDPHLRAL